jgi:acyl carrier protein
MATKEQIDNDLKKMLVEDLFVEIPVDEIKGTDSLSTDIGLDSVAHLELFALIEDRYRIKIATEPEAYENYRTVQLMVDYIYNNLQSAAAAG